jgi:hypothetical protein
MTVEVDPETQAEGQIAAYFADDTVTDNPPERAAPKSPLPHDGKLDEMKQQYSEMMEAIKLKEQEKKEKEAKAEQAERDQHAEEERNLAEEKAAKEAAEEQKAFEIQKLATAMREAEEKLASLELAQMKEEIAAQVQKDAKEQAIKEREHANEVEREMDAQVKRDTKQRMERRQH